MLTAEQAKKESATADFSGLMRWKDIVEAFVMVAVKDGANSVSVELVPQRYHEWLRNWLTELGYTVECGDDQRNGSYFAVRW